MNAVLKRILLHGGLTAGLLALVGLLFGEMAQMWMRPPTGTTAAPEPDPAVGTALRYRVPLMMAFWGFAFVAVSELVLSRFRKRAPAKPAEPPADDAEKLLNELLAQAEAKMALEQGLGDRGEGTGSQESGARGQEAAEKKPEPGA